MRSLSASCVWQTTPQLLLALQERFGDPLDTYVNGSQVWLREDGPKEMTFEWRLHPVAKYQRPDGMTTESVFSSVTFAIANHDDPPVPPASLWDGLEVFAAYNDEIEPAILARCASDALGLMPDASGLVDHASIGATWERTQGAVSIIELLITQLTKG